ncbi:MULTISPECIES: TRAP transporter permease [unclassified Pyramidobacter]|uniref:TRAP transporter permease n=1 Tax=unclassified Pyramidobacter TaxID=2632171 RepID=UPI001F3B6A19|nr:MULTISPECIES: TRAP transporter permease [unclassified Pyramidobacter]WOL39440.1 TRAP transporter permease [Pyramidobacter sp. YE332]
MSRKKLNEVPQNVDLSELERDSRYRIFSGGMKVFLTVVLTCFALFQLYASLSGRLPQQILRYGHLGFAISLAFIIYPTTKKSSRRRINPLDVIFALTFLTVIMYFIGNFKALQLRAGEYTTLDTVMAGLGVFLVLLACWRVVGPPIVIIASCFMLYGLMGARGFFAVQMPGFLAQRGYQLPRIITHLFITTEGVIGNPIGVCSTYIFLFILFGSCLEKTGIGQFFIDLANALAGWAVGGPAKVAVLSSALQGTVSGSSVANTVSTGSFTIPLMKSLGYEPEFAGAVEAAASTGGQIMPPVMGSAAFLIAESVGIPYSQLMLVALIPALLYFSGIWIMVDFEARRKGLKGLPREKLPPAKPLLLQKGHLVLPLAAIIYFMLSGFTITRSALWGIMIAALVPFLKKSTWVSPKQILEALPLAARNIVSVATACATAGIIVGMVTLTGLGQRIGGGMFQVVGGNVFLGLMCAMITSLVLGMGVSTTSNYIITSTVAAPILIHLGIPLLAAHMFCFYFGIIADITPPVALAAYAGSAIAKGNPFRTGVNASKLAIAAFLVPYMFALDPKLIMIDGTFLEALPMIATALVGLFGIGGGLIGYINAPIESYWRLLMIAGGLGLLIPGTISDLIGAAVILAVYFFTRRKKAGE